MQTKKGEGRAGKGDMGKEWGACEGRLGGAFGSQPMPVSRGLRRKALARGLLSWEAGRLQDCWPGMCWEHWEMLALLAGTLDPHVQVLFLPTRASVTCAAILPMNGKTELTA